MRTPTAILAAATLLAANLATAHAATLTVGYANVSLNTGNSLSFRTADYRIGYAMTF